MNLIRIIFGLFFLVQIISGEAYSARENNYRIAVRDIPINMHPKYAQNNLSHLILLQMYYPLFATNQSPYLTSYFLNMRTTKALDKHYKHFQLCLNEEVTFNDGTLIQIEHLMESLSVTHSQVKSLPNIEMITRLNDRCLSIALQCKDFHYFHKLTGIDSTILKVNKKVENIPMGSGPYQIIHHSRSLLILETTTPFIKENPKKFQKITFLKLDLIDPRLSNEVDDWNHIYQTEIPESIKNSFQSVNAPTKKVYALVINYPNLIDRQSFSRKLDRIDFLKTLDLSLDSVPGFLPNSLSGYNVEYAEILKSFSNRPIKNHFTFITHHKKQYHLLGPFLKNMENKFFIHIDLKLLSLNEMTAYVYSGKPYIGLLGFDSTGSGYSNSKNPFVFFESFIENEKIISKRLMNIKNLIQQTDSTYNLEKQEILFTQAHQQLLKSAYLIPLGQMQSVQYYPQKIKRVIWGDQMSGLPLIQHFRIQ